MNRNNIRIACLLLCTACALGLCACGNSDHSSSTSSAAPNVSTESTVDSLPSDSDNKTDLPLTDLTVLPENTYEDTTIFADQIVVAAGTEKVPYRIMLYNNPGYGFAGIRLTYDADLNPYLEEDNIAVFDDGDATDQFLSTCLNSQDEHMLGFAGFATNGADSTADGIMFTCYFDIPADAASGTVYDFKLEVVDFNTIAGDAVEVDTVSGSITVQ